MYVNKLAISESLLLTTSCLGGEPSVLSLTGAVLSVPGRLINPRRTYHQPTSNDQQELLLQYEPVLRYDPRSVVDQLSLVERVTSFGGERESISYLLASGQSGIKMVQTNPSNSFDSLTNHFNKIQLIITISLLTIALGSTNKLVSKLIWVPLRPRRLADPLDFPDSGSNQEIERKVVFLMKRLLKYKRL